MIRRQWAVAVAASVLALPAYGEKPQIQWNNAYDFGAVETFQWQLTPETSLEQRNPFMHSLVKNSIEQELATSGLTEVQSNPDVYVNYHASTDTEVRLESDSYGYGFGAYGMGGWGYYGYGAAGPVSTTTRVVEYNRGTLVVDVWDAASKELVWRGTVSDVLPDNPQKAEKLVQKAIAKLAAQGRKLWAKEQASRAG